MILSARSGSWVLASRCDNGLRRIGCRRSCYGGLRNAAERGLGGFLSLEPDAIAWLTTTSEGDARRALTALESVALFAGGAGGPPLGVADVQPALESALDRQPIPYDKGGEEHYNVV